ncbi:MAG TPA: hypothetical protein VKF32_02615 [Thermoanaerobaculia bacterium]|nr:hypothetical protein [Thermoanaerobaculia bacterium]
MLRLFAAGVLSLVLGPPAAAAAERVPALVTYTFEESSSSVTPNGERAAALAARVEVADEKVRVEISGSSFPRARGSILIVDGAKAVLVDPKAREGAHLDVSELDTLFLAPAADDGGGAGVRLREKTITVARDGEGAPFQGVSTKRWRVTVNAFVNVTTPGRVATIHGVTRGTIETVEWPDAASPIDGLARLFRARGEVRTALEEELRRVEGFPVRVKLEGETEMSAEPVGEGIGHEVLERPMKTTVRAERSVHDLTRRPLSPRDAALFTVPEDVRLRAPERLVRQETLAR